MEEVEQALLEVDEDGAPIGTASPVEVLDKIRYAQVVVPSQFSDFVSQSPFFVSVGERVYFVEPHVDEDEDLEGTTTAEEPSVLGLTSFRAKTWAATEEQVGTPLFDDDALALTVYMDRSTVRSTDAEVSALKAVDATFRSFTPLATVTGLLPSTRGCCPTGTRSTIGSSRSATA